MKKIERSTQMTVNAGSMADIAFLLLIFFTITTTIVNDKGIGLLLPPYQPEPQVAEIRERNIFKILINSDDKLLIEGEPREKLFGLREDIKTFILNNGRLENLSEAPDKAVVSIKTNRGTSYEMYIKTLDEVQAAYFEIYAGRVNLSPVAFRNLKLTNPHEKSIHNKGKKGIPMNISIAELDWISG